MVWLFTMLGLIVIAVGLNDMFRTLLYPGGRGRLGHHTARAVWRLCRRSQRLIQMAGPLAIVCVIIVWCLLQAVGWALVYYPHVPQGFSYSPGINPSEYPDVVQALYFSVVTLSTLGYGDVFAVDGWIRLISPLQGVTGFALLTGAVSWFIQIYPTLSRRRTLALRLRQLADSRYAQNLSQLDPVAASRTLESVAGEVAQVQVDLTQNSATYYFRDNPKMSLPASVSYALEVCTEAQKSASLDVRVAADALETALDDLAATVGKEFGLERETTREIFQAFASDHQHGSGNAD